MDISLKNAIAPGQTACLALTTRSGEQVVILW